MNEHNEKIDPDILKGRDDISRARRAKASDPSSKKANSDEPEVQPKTENQQEKQLARKVPREPSPVMKAVVDANRQKQPARDEQSEIPAFDVSKKILARQRMAATAKRTAPMNRSQTEHFKQTRRSPLTARIEYIRPPHNSLVADIVARDIDRLCRA